MLGYAAILLQLALGAAVGGAFLWMARFVGPHNPGVSKNSTYECGVPPIGSARERFPVRFYLIATLFILFDIEALFMYPWAILARSLGLAGFVEMVIFILILIVGLVYVWRKGALEWE